MGQKVNPIGFRLGITRTWESKWFSSKNYIKWFHEDLNFRKYLKEKFYSAGVSRILIERSVNKVRINVFVARPGMVIGKKGSGIDAVKKELQKFTTNETEIYLNINEVRKPELDAQLIAENIASQLEKRVAFRRAMKKSVLNAMKFGALGIKIMAGGRLAGAEIARSEWYREGRVPLQTLRADIDYGFAEANTTYGKIGVKVWLFKGEVLSTK
ncbi:MAG: 30S ribosomal protein S3 [Deltaproteobacteria bacterium]|nr:30S ribosomal protein S3 [Deltaproteobacteria bacterium]